MRCFLLLNRLHFSFLLCLWFILRHFLFHVLFLHRLVSYFSYLGLSCSRTFSQSGLHCFIVGLGLGGMMRRVMCCCSRVLLGFQCFARLFLLDLYCCLLFVALFLNCLLLVRVWFCSLAHFFFLYRYIWHC